MQARTEVSTDRAVIAAFKEIGQICAAMKLLDTVKKQAEEFYKQAYDNAKSIKGKSQAAVLAAIVFLACRHTGNARTFKEICAVVPQASVKVKRTKARADRTVLGGWHSASLVCSWLL
jgi:transcription initiation factor TFIIB